MMAGAIGLPVSAVARGTGARADRPLRRGRDQTEPGGYGGHYVYNFVGMGEVHVVATEDVPTGDGLILSASFDKQGEDPPGVAVGALSLWHGDVKVGEGPLKTQPGKFMIAGEGLCIGRDGGAGVTADYPGAQPWRFTGGTIRRVAVDVSGEPYIDLEREAQAMMMRE